MSNPADTRREREGQDSASTEQEREEESTTSGGTEQEREEESTASGGEGGNRATSPLAESPAQLPRQSWLGVLKRAFKAYQADNVGNLAAALTYYGLQAMFPALFALVSVVGLIGHSATNTLISNLGKLAPGTGRQIFTSAINGLDHSRGAAGVLFVLGLVGALWSASGYVSTFTWAANTIYGVQEGRPFYTRAPQRLLLTLVMVLLLAISALAVVVTGGLAGRVGQLIGVGGTAVSVWDIAKWPVLLLIVAAMISLLYWAAPNVKQPGFRWLTPGGIFAVLVWVVASALFALYVANFGSYNKTYGTLAGVIIFLVWLWITNVAILLGVELNAELYRGRELAAGHPADQEPFVEPRQAKKPKD